MGEGIPLSLASGLGFSWRGKKRRPEGKIGGRAENLPNHCSAEELRNVRLRNVRPRHPVFLTPLTPRPRTRWRSVRPKLWPPCRALGTTWAPSAPPSVSIHPLSGKGFERELGMEQEGSCKLDALRCNLIGFVVSERLKVCQTLW